MREIKFRAFNKKTNEIGTVDNLLRCTVDVNVEIADICFCELKKWQREDCEIMQFTGLYNRNGKEIYEGDILAGVNGSINGVPIPHKPLLVEYITDNSGNFPRFRVPLWGTKDNCDKTHFLEVIGNIYEDKELLEQ
jgi:uncharacterized phage protein (TIGR01671 family)